MGTLDTTGYIHHCRTHPGGDLSDEWQKGAAGCTAFCLAYGYYAVPYFCNHIYGRRQFFKGSLPSGATTLIRFRNPVKNPFTTIVMLATVGAGAAAGFGFYLGSLLLALFCFATVWMGNHFTKQTGRDVVRVLYLDCNSGHYPDRILKSMGKWLKKWVKLSIETSTTDDRSHWYYQVYLRDVSQIDELVKQFQHYGIAATILVPQDLKEF